MAADIEALKSGRIKSRAYTVLLAWLVMSAVLADIGVTRDLVGAVRQGAGPSWDGVLAGLGSPTAWEYVLAWMAIGITSVLIQRAGRGASLEAVPLTVAFAWSLINYLSGALPYRPSFGYSFAYFACLACGMFVSGYVVLIEQLAATRLIEGAQ